MKVKLTRQLHTQHRVLDEGLLGEAVGMVKDMYQRVLTLSVVFYGLPGVYEIDTLDLENL